MKKLILVLTLLGSMSSFGEGLCKVELQIEKFQLDYSQGVKAKRVNDFGECLEAIAKLAKEPEVLNRLNRRFVNSIEIEYQYQDSYSEYSGTLIID